jgi:hypothetical protein
MLSLCKKVESMLKCDKGDKAISVFDAVAKAERQLTQKLK